MRKGRGGSFVELFNGIIHTIPNHTTIETYTHGEEMGLRETSRIRNKFDDKKGHQFDVKI